MKKLQHHTIACLITLFASLLLPAAPALAAHPDANSEIENLKRRIEILEAQQADTENAAPADEQVDLGQINKYVTLHGLLEVEAYYANSEGGDEESDIDLATAELAIEATLNDYVGGHLILLYEEEDGEDDDIDVDEAVISLSSPAQLFGQSPSLHAGRMYVPFGMFNSYMISDPLTLDLGETQDTALLTALEGDVWSLQAGVFNGDTDTDGDNDNIDSWVASLEVAPGERLQFGVSYISDLAESDIELIDTNVSIYSSSVAGASAFLTMHCGDFGLEAEYLAAIEDFDRDVVNVGTDLTGRRPEAWNLELVWMPLDRLQVAARYEQADDFQDDVRRYGATVSYGLHEHVVLAFEYLHADAKAAEDDPMHTATAQLALEF